MDQAAILAALKAIQEQVAALTKVVMEKPATETPEQFYLRSNADVAAHPWFKDHPKEHWDMWGHKEGRPSMWPVPGAAPVVTPAPAPAPVTPPPEKYQYEPNGLLRTSKGVKVKINPVNGARIDPPIDEDCPIGVKTPKGRVLSKARPDLGEMFMGYCQRVSWQLGREQEVNNTLGSLILAASPTFLKIGGFKEDGSNWPEAADRIYHVTDYLTQEEKDAKARSDREWDEHWKNKEYNKPAPAPAPTPAPPVEVEVPVE